MECVAIVFSNRALLSVCGELPISLTGAWVVFSIYLFEKSAGFSHMKSQNTMKLFYPLQPVLPAWYKYWHSEKKIKPFPIEGKKYLCLLRQLIVLTSLGWDTERLDTDGYMPWLIKKNREPRETEMETERWREISAQQSGSEHLDF